jgi:hypothetical protein
MKKLFLAILFLGLPLLAAAGDFFFLAEHFIDSDRDYVIYINKYEMALYLVNRDLVPEKKYPVSLAKWQGIKLQSGDEKTPEGDYFITAVFSEEEPRNLKAARKRLSEAEKMKEKPSYYKQLKKEFARAHAEHVSGRQILKKMNEQFFSAKNGHTKYGTAQDAGTGVFGPVYLELNYPNNDDLERFAEAVRKGVISEEDIKRKPGRGIAIHGTNDEAAIGHEASVGCIRLKNKDVVELLKYVGRGTVVIIR